MAAPSEEDLRSFLSSLEQTSSSGETDDAPPGAKRARNRPADESPIEKEIAVQPGISIQIAQGRMKAMLAIEPGALELTTGKRADLSSLRDAVVRGLDQLNITVGRSDENVAKALQLARSREHARIDVVLAEGIPATDGAAQQVYLLAFGKHKEQLLKPDEQLQIPVLQGQKVLRIEDARTPLAGKTIDGEEAPGKTVSHGSLEFGENLKVDPGGIATARIEGALHVDEGRVWIVPVDRDASVEVTISKDEMRAAVTITPASGKGKPAFVADVQRVLGESGVTEGISRDAIEAAIKKALKQGKRVEKAVVAKGQAAVPGMSDDVTLQIQIPDYGERYWIKGDGSVDFYNLERIVCIEKGEVLAEVTPGSPGKPGKTVRGDVLEPQILQQSELTPGTGIVRTKDGKFWVAAVAGQLHQEGRVVSVRQIYRVEGNLDFATGNIDFIGDVLVQGDIVDGFSVRAGGDITVTGSVGAAELEAGGSEVGLGISGKERATVRCSGNLVCSYLQEVSVRCGGDLVAASQILHSDVRVSGVVEVIAGKGMIVGGKVLGGRGIRVKNLGSDYETQSEVEAGVDWKELERSLRADKTLEDAKGNLAKLQSMVTNLETGADEELRVRAEQQLAILNRALEQAKSERSEARLKMFVDPPGRVTVLNTLSPGVHIRIREARYRVREEAHAVIASYDAERGQIVLQRLKS